MSLEDDTPLTRTLSQPAVAPSTAPVDADAQIAHWAAVLSGSANYEGWIDALKTIHLTLGGESDAYKNFTGTGRLDPLVRLFASCGVIPASIVTLVRRLNSWL